MSRHDMSGGHTDLREKQIHMNGWITGYNAAQHEGAKSLLTMRTPQGEALVALSHTGRVFRLVDGQIPGWAILPALPVEGMEK